MTRLNGLFVALAVVAVNVPPASATPFFDDFSTDTSANYVLTDTFGAGGTFDISGGTLNVFPGAGNTADVFHSTAQLAAGEYASVYAPATNNRDFYLTVSTINRGPNTGAEDGIRWNVLDTPSFRARTYRDGAGTNTVYPSPDALLDLTLYVVRDTLTEYRVGYDAGAGFTPLDTLTINETAGAAGLFVGVEAFDGAAGQTYNFDDLTIGDAASLVPEPSAAALAFLAGTLGVVVWRRRTA